MGRGRCGLEAVTAGPILSISGSGLWKFRATCNSTGHNKVFGLTVLIARVDKKELAVSDNCQVFEYIHVLPHILYT